MNKGIKLIMYPYASDIEMKGLTKKHANEIFITDNMSIEDIDIFIKEILQDSYDNSLSYDEIFKNTIDNIRLYDMDIEAILYFYDNDIVITSDNTVDSIDTLYSDIEEALADQYDFMQFGIDINAYHKGNNIIIVDYDMSEFEYEIYNTRGMKSIDYDEMTDKMSKRYEINKIIYDKDSFHKALNAIIEIYHRFINVSIRRRLLELSTKYGNELTDLVYNHSNWKGELL